MQLNIYQLYYCHIFLLYFNDSALATLSLKGKVHNATQNSPIQWMFTFLLVLVSMIFWQKSKSFIMMHIHKFWLNIAFFIIQIKMIFIVLINHTNCILWCTWVITSCSWHFQEAAKHCYFVLYFYFETDTIWYLLRMSVSSNRFHHKHYR